MDLKEAQQLVDDLEPKIERLKSLYQQYFMGIEKIPPHVLRKDVERTIFRMRRSKLQNTRIRFKFQQLVQRYNTYDQYWGRILRQIEKGTYKRDLRRAAKRFGQDEALEIAGRKDRAALKGIEEDEEPQDAGPPVYELPDPDGFEIDLGFDEDDMPTPPSRRAPRPAPQAYHAQEVWDPGDLYSEPPSPSAPPPNADPYAHQRQSQPAPSPYQAQPQRAPLSRDPRAYQDAVPAPVGTQPGYPPPPGSQARGGYPSQNPAVPATPREPLPPPGHDPAPARASRPRGGGALFGGKARRSNPGAPPPEPRPAPPQPYQAQPQAPAPALPRRPGAPPSRPPPPAPRRPGAPPRRPPPPAPGGRGPQRPAPAPAAPAPAQRPAPQPAAQPAAQRPAPQRPQRPAGDDRARAVYDEYMRARQRTGKGANVSYDAMRKSLEKQASQLRKRHGSNRKVDFEVVEKDGKPLIRPVVK